MIIKGYSVLHGDGNAHCKYELVNGKHYVYFESNNTARKMQLPSSGLAMDLMKRLTTYNKLRDKIN